MGDGQVTGVAAGMAVAATALGLARDQLGERLESGYAIGSLAHGGFAESMSDVDIAILGTDDVETARVAEGLKDATSAATDSGLARRLSVFHCTWERFSAPGVASRFPAIDRLDLMQNGALVLGRDLRGSRGTAPGRDELLEELIRFATRKLGTDEAIEALSFSALSRAEPREVTLTVLYPARLLFLARTGRAGSNHEAARYYADAGAIGAGLALAAVEWRRSGRVDNAELAQLGGASLVPMHRAVLEEVGEIPGVPAVDELARLERRLRDAEDAAPTGLNVG